MSDDRPILPAVIGMPRSASRMTWQILKFLLPDKRPPWWSPSAPATYFGDGDWPVRRHAYMKDVPTIYTYRHPVEAYLSYLSRTMQDVGEQLPETLTSPDSISGLHEDDWDNTYEQTPHRAASDVMKAIGGHWDLYKVLKEECVEGRPVLFLKYEEFHDNPAGRVNAIAEFMSIDVHPDMMQQILAYTNIEINARRGKAIADYLPHAIFSSGFHPKTGMQKEHVNLEIMGEPGKHLATNPEFVCNVFNGAQPAYQALHEMCVYFGYDVLENS